MGASEQIALSWKTGRETALGARYIERQSTYTMQQGYETRQQSDEWP
jgi:hypothetical protein